MKPDCNRCTVVMAGVWNQSIFTSPWVAGVLGCPEPRMDAALGPSGLLFRLSLDKMSLEVLPHQLLLIPDIFSDEVFQRMEATAVAFLERLRETPVRATGVNFGFNISEPPAPLHALFRFSDDEMLRGADAVVGAASITRKLWVNDRVLNLSTRSVGVGGPCQLDFNFHHDASDANGAAETIRGQVVSLKNRALQLATSIYGLSLGDS